MRTFHCAQRSEEWFELHIGRVTASYMADVLDFKKTGDKGPGAKRLAYMGKKVAETITGLMDMTGYVSPAMQWGNEHEDEARQAYELTRKTVVDEIGFAIHPEIERFGASPDGLISNNGLLEIKCPETSTHIRWIMGGVVPDEHRPQMFAQMSVLGRDWCDFVSYDPRLTRRYQLFIPPPLNATTEAILEVETHVRQFLGEMDAMIQRLGELCPQLEEEEKAPKMTLDMYLSDKELENYI